jgi:cell division protein FtsQ
MADPIVRGDPPSRPPSATPTGGPAPSRARRRLRAIALLVTLAALGSAPWWGRAALQRLAFFRVRKVEIEGVRYLAPGEIVSRLRVDTSTSVWVDLGPLERRVAAHPQVRAVEIDRRLPGTLLVRVTEKLPVALVPGRAGLRIYDAAGDSLPIDPSLAGVDLPILAQRDTGLLRLLAGVQVGNPTLYARISEVRRVGRDELVLRLASALTPPAEPLPVRAMADVSVGRLADIFPVESDLAHRQARVAELDLRYRDQVIARLQ